MGEIVRVRAGIACHDKRLPGLHIQLTTAPESAFPCFCLRVFLMISIFLRDSIAIFLQLHIDGQHDVVSATGALPMSSDSKPRSRPPRQDIVGRIPSVLEIPLRIKFDAGFALRCRSSCSRALQFVVLFGCDRSIYPATWSDVFRIRQIAPFGFDSDRIP